MSELFLNMCDLLLLLLIILLVKIQKHSSIMQHVFVNIVTMPSTPSVYMTWQTHFLLCYSTVLVPYNAHRSGLNERTNWWMNESSNSVNKGSKFLTGSRQLPGDDEQLVAERSVKATERHGSGTSTLNDVPVMWQRHSDDEEQHE